MGIAIEAGKIINVRRRCYHREIDCILLHITKQALFSGLPDGLSSQCGSPFIFIIPEWSFVRFVGLCAASSHGTVLYSGDLPCMALHVSLPHVRHCMSACRIIGSLHCSITVRPFPRAAPIIFARRARYNGRRDCKREDDLHVEF